MLPLLACSSINLNLINRLGLNFICFARFLSRNPCLHTFSSTSYLFSGKHIDMDHVGSDNQDYHMYFALLLHSEEFRDCYSSTIHCYQTLYHIAASVWSVLMHCFIKE